MGATTTTTTIIPGRRRRPIVPSTVVTLVGFLCWLCVFGFLVPTTTAAAELQLQYKFSLVHRKQPTEKDLRATTDDESAPVIDLRTELQLPGELLPELEGTLQEEIDEEALTRYYVAFSHEGKMLITIDKKTTVVPLPVEFFRVISYVPLPADLELDEPKEFVYAVVGSSEAPRSMLKQALVQWVKDAQRGQPTHASRRKRDRAQLKAMLWGFRFTFQSSSSLYLVPITDEDLIVDLTPFEANATKATTATTAEDLAEDLAEEPQPDEGADAVEVRVVHSNEGFIEIEGESVDLPPFLFGVRVRKSVQLPRRFWARWEDKEFVYINEPVQRMAKRMLKKQLLEHLGQEEPL